MPILLKVVKYLAFTVILVNLVPSCSQDAPSSTGGSSSSLSSLSSMTNFSSSSGASSTSASVTSSAASSSTVSSSIISSVSSASVQTISSISSASSSSLASNIAFTQPHDSSANLYMSAWADPNGSDYDMYVYDNFTCSTNCAITKVRWRGGYINERLYGSYVSDFTVTFFESIAGGSEPHLGNPQLEDTNPIYLVKYTVGGNAGETAAGTFGGKAMFDYEFTLPAVFNASNGVKYWIRLEASQSGVPDWGIASGSGGDNQHFNFSTGAARFSFYSGDAAITLLQ